MAFKKKSKGSSHGSGEDKEFWQQLDHEFPFPGVDEEELRQHTTQWITCANELLGPVPSRMKKKAKR